MKKIVFNLAKFSYFFSAMMLLFSGHVYAYIDPSATTYVIQAVGALIVALGAVITVFRHKIVSIFKKNSNGDNKKEIHFDDTDDEDSNK